MTVDKATLEAGIAAYELFHLAGFKDSKGEARKLIEGGGGRINDEKVAHPKMKITLSHITQDGFIKLSSGKKHHLLIKIREAVIIMHFKKRNKAIAKAFRIR